ncbi:hypothetical protein [Billgrantia saliphila]|uniref:hypothetical protein n=1 Tax=Billgrantia saliphila TaxID=1848458 RepID=UPI000CE315A7|nr:hypothetical protein [Halomonas saliphila]
MTVTVLWLIAFALIFYFSYIKWESSVSPGLNKIMPRVLKSGHDNRWVWSLALAVIGATTLVRPIDMLLTAIVVAVLLLVVKKLADWALGRANFH